MTLAELIKQASQAANTYSTVSGSPMSRIVSGGLSVLDKSINKSSPGFKATTTNQAGVPVATDAQKPSIPTPEPIKDPQGNPIATPVDWYGEFAYRAQQGDKNAQQWLMDNVIDDTTQDSNQFDFGGNEQVDFSTPTSQVAYSMEKLNELYGTKSPEDLWALRQKLRFQQSQAAAGMLPEEEYMRFQGEGVTDGAPRYNYEQRMGVNRATADIFGTQVADIDKFMDDFSKGEKASAAAGGLSFGGMEPWQQSIINATSVGSTKDERNANRQDLIMAASQGADAFVQALIGKGEANLKGTQLDEFNSRITNVAALQSALASLESSGIKLSNFRSVKNRAEEIFGKQSPEYAAVQMLFEQVSASERNKIFGASLTGNEQAAANKFVINDKDTNETAMMKANKMIGVMNYANDIAALKATGATRQKIDEWQKAGYLKTFDEYTGGTSNSSAGETFPWNGQTYKKNPDGSATLVSFSQVGSGTNKAINSIDDVLKRIAKVEGSGKYDQLGPVVKSGQYKGQRAIGRYQVMPGNVPSWTMEALGVSMTPQQFLNNPQAQEAVARHQMMKTYKKYGNWNDVASVWFTGRPLAQGKNAKDVLGTTGAEYVRRFNS